MENIKNSEAIRATDKNNLLKVVSMAYVAERFFGKSRYWLSHRLNGNIINGKPAEFKPDEYVKFKEALHTIAKELDELADNL